MRGQEKSINSKRKIAEPVKQKVGTKVFASNAKVRDKTQKNQKFLHNLSVNVNKLFETAPYSKRKKLHNEQSM